MVTAEVFAFTTSADTDAATRTPTPATRSAVGAGTAKSLTRSTPVPTGYACAAPCAPTPVKRRGRITLDSIRP